MKTTHIILAAIIAATTAVQAAPAEHKLPAPLPEFKTPEQLAVWRQEMAAKAKAADALAAKYANSESKASTSAFYTGKPYVKETGSYGFMFRQYDPEHCRWTTIDPSGFPDAANVFLYINNHALSSFDPNGLAEVTFNCSLSLNVGDPQATINRSINGKFSYTLDAKGEHFSNVTGSWNGGDNGVYSHTAPNKDTWTLNLAGVFTYQGVTTWEEPSGNGFVTWHQDWVKYNAEFQLDYAIGSNIGTTSYNVGTQTFQGQPYE